MKESDDHLMNNNWGNNNNNNNELQKWVISFLARLSAPPAAAGE
jgi:hypothetical protein